MLGPILGTGDRGVNQVRSPPSWTWVLLWWSPGAHNKQTNGENLKIELLHPTPAADSCSQGAFSGGLPDHPWRSVLPSPHANISEYLYIHWSTIPLEHKLSKGCFTSMSPLPTILAQGRHRVRICWMTEWSPGRWRAGLTNPEAQNELGAPHTPETGWSVWLDGKKMRPGRCGGPVWWNSVRKGSWFQLE